MHLASIHPYYQPWLEYQSPLVRQLAFAIASPNLLNTTPKEIEIHRKIDFHHQQDWQKFYQQYQPRLLELDKNPYPLECFLAKIKSTRLGLRFETLLWFWLQDEANEFYELLGHSIQTHHQGKTLGEIDFLVKNLITLHIEHWEVCLKYYFAANNLAIQHWVGLNPEDTLFQKMNHFHHHQFQFDNALGHHIENRFIIIKGQLYLSPEVATAHLPNWINVSRQLGIWQNIPPQTENWRRLTRQEWICPLFTEEKQSSDTTQWWSNGLYINQDEEQFLMLKLKRPLSPITK